MLLGALSSMVHIWSVLRYKRTRLRYADPGPGVQVRVSMKEDPELLAQLAGQSWFSDGLDDDDAALLHGISYAKGDFREALIETNYVASTTVTLPLTGEMGLAVVRHTPFLSDDQTLKTLEEGVRIMEDFMGAPLPVGDVTLLLVEPEFWTLEARAQHFRFIQHGDPLKPAYVRGIISAVNPQPGPPTRTLYHEVGHNYLLDGPRWLEEGLANFLEAYTVARTGGEGLEERLAYLESSERCAENIWDHVNPYTGGQCNYELGEKFLLGMYATLGPDAVSAALKELYTQTVISDRLNHDSIYSRVSIERSPREGGVVPDSLASLSWQPRHRPGSRGLSRAARFGGPLQRHRRGKLGNQQQLAQRRAIGGMVRCLHQLRRPGHRTGPRQK